MLKGKSLLLAEEHERALLVADDDVGHLVVVQVRGGDLRADTRVVVDLVRDETHTLPSASRCSWNQ